MGNLVHTEDAKLAIWGTVILLGVQIYLLSFLKQLSGKLGPDDAGWDVPWVGMDQTKFDCVSCF